RRPAQREMALVDLAHAQRFGQRERVRETGLVGFWCDDPDIIRQGAGDALQNLKTLGMNSVVIRQQDAHNSPFLVSYFPIPDGNPETTFPGTAWFIPNSGRNTGNHFSWNCLVRSQFRTENRKPLFLELLGSFAIPDGKPETTFPGIAWFVRNSGRKTGN